MTRDGEEISLTATEFELLRFLMRNPRRVLSKAQILDRVWNYDFGGQANVVELYISYLRKKIDAGRAPMIHTMRGAGLRAQAGMTVAHRAAGPDRGRAGPRAVSLLIGVAATLAIRNRLTGQVDDQLARDRSRRPAARAGAAAAPGQHSRPGTIVGRASPTTRPRTVGYRSAAGGGSGRRPLSADDELAPCADVPADGEVHDRRDRRARQLPRPGRRGRSGAAPSSSALPTDDVDDAVGRWSRYEVGADRAGALLAAGGGLLLVRRQLRPLREVAATADRVSELPLSEGEIDLTERVPAHLTDERTEVGQVGAALNTLLEHVGSSLAARHRSEQQVRQFVADASHELRTPLATIAGYTELARRRPDPAETPRPRSTKVEEESVRMTALVEDLLLLARLDAGRPLASEPVDLTHLLLEAVSDARVLGPEHQWRLELPEEPVEVQRRRAAAAPGGHQPAHQRPQAHPGRHHGRPSTARPDGFDVHDDGPGFPPDFVGKAFERFARGRRGPRADRRGRARARARGGDRALARRVGDARRAPRAAPRSRCD